MVSVDQDWAKCSLREYAGHFFIPKGREFISASKEASTVVVFIIKWDGSPLPTSEVSAPQKCHLKGQATFCFDFLNFLLLLGAWMILAGVGPYEKLTPGASKVSHLWQRHY